jgi:hypothetical protein
VVRAPMPVIAPPPPASVPTEPSLRIPMQSNRGMFLTFVAGIVVAGGGFYAFTQYQSEVPKENAPMVFPQSKGATTLQEDSSSSRRADSVPAATSTPASTPGIATPPAVAEVCPAPCCGGVDCKTTEENRVKPELCQGSKASCETCYSGRTCVPGICKTELDPAGRWLLRLAGVLAPSGKALSDVFPDATVCLRLTTAAPNDPWACTLARAGGMPPAMETRLEATTSDLYVHGIDIRITPLPGLDPMASKTRALTPGHILNSALCRGLNLRGAKDSLGQDYTVTVYLDEPGPSP